MWQLSAAAAAAAAAATKGANSVAGAAGIVSCCLALTFAAAYDNVPAVAGLVAKGVMLCWTQLLLCCCWSSHTSGHYLSVAGAAAGAVTLSQQCNCY